LAQIKYVIQQKNSQEIIKNGMQKAKNMIGIVETPPKSNSGKWIDIFLNSIELKSGNAWCVAFCQWAYRTAASELFTKFNLLKTGQSLLLFNYVSKHGIKSYLKPEYGDWVIFEKTNSIWGHTAFLLEYHNNYIITLEGNTSNEDNSNDGVFIKKRAVNKFGWLKLKGFISFRE